MPEHGTERGSSRVGVGRVPAPFFGGILSSCPITVVPTYQVVGGYFGLILKAPSSRITAPFSMGFS